MKMLTLFAALTLDVYADGLPIWDGKIHTEHVLVSLNQSQQEEIVALQSVTLTPTQWAKLRKENPAIPKRIESVLPATWDDCLCGWEGEFVGIQWKPDQLAVLTDYMGPSIDQKLAESDPNFTVDSRGQFYSDGTLVPFSKVLSHVAKRKPSDESRYFSIDIPLNMKRTDDALNSRLSAVEKAAIKQGFEVWIH